MPFSSLVDISGRAYTVESLDHLEPLKRGLQVAADGTVLGEVHRQRASLVVSLLEPRGILSQGPTILERLAAGERVVTGEGAR